MTPATKLWLAAIAVPFAIWIIGEILQVASGGTLLWPIILAPLALSVGVVLFVVSLVVTIIGAGVKTGNKGS